MNTLTDKGVGHIRIFEGGTKYYMARYRVDLQTRWSLRKFRTAEAAEQYGRRLVARYEALKKVAV